MFRKRQSGEQSLAPLIIQILIEEYNQNKMAKETLEQRVGNFLSVTSAENKFRESPHDYKIREYLEEYLASNMPAALADPVTGARIDLKTMPAHGIDRIIQDAKGVEKGSLSKYVGDNLDEVVGKTNPNLLAGYVAEVMPSGNDKELDNLIKAYKDAKEAMGNPNEMVKVVSGMLEGNPFRKTMSYLASVDQRFLSSMYEGVITSRLNEVASKLKGKEANYVTENLKALAVKDPEKVTPLYEQLGTLAYNPGVYAQLYGDQSKEVIRFAGTVDAIERAEKARADAVKEAQKKAA